MDFNINLCIDCSKCSHLLLVQTHLYSMWLVEVAKANPEFERNS